MKEITIIVPCYNEEDNISRFYQEILSVFSTSPADRFRPRFIFVDDGSSDATLAKIKTLSKQDGRVGYLSFSRNFGKESAIYAGLEHAAGDYTVIMDVDLQDPPALIPEMIRLLETGDCDAVATRRSDRKGEPPIRSFFARCFYKIIRKISNVEIVDGARDFRMMNRPYVDSLLKLGEYNRFSKGLFGWVGYRVKWLEYDNIQRERGTTKWSFWKLFLYSIDGIVAFSVVPAVFSAVFGILFCLLALLFLAVVFFRALLYGDPVSGWPSTICVILLVGGVQLFCLGVLGQYMAKTYLEVKKRPIYLCRESNLTQTHSREMTD